MNNPHRVFASIGAMTYVRESISLQRKEILKISDPRHRTDLLQQLDKARRWALKWAEESYDINRWLNEFGPALPDPADGDD